MRFWLLTLTLVGYMSLSGCVGNVKEVDCVVVDNEVVCEPEWGWGGPL